jgi:hypothetical protein
MSSTNRGVVYMGPGKVEVQGIDVRPSEQPVQEPCANE